MATRLISLVVAFFMVASLEGMAQIGSSPESSSQGSSLSASVPQPKKTVLKSTQRTISSISQRIQTRSGDILKITHEGNETQYSDWTTAMDALQEGDEITLLQDITFTMDGGDNPMPTKPCIINGGDSNYTLKFQNNNSEPADCDLQAAITFKSIILSANLLMANGNQILFESGATMNSGFVFGGGTTEVASTSITIKDGATLTNVYGGGFSGKVTGNTQVTVEGGSVTSIYAGGYQAPVDGTANLTISGGSVGNNNSIFGGGNEAGATCGNTNVILSGGTINAWVFGGGNEGLISGTAKVSLQGSTINKNLYGGSRLASAICKNTDVTVSGGSVNWLFGGGEQGSVTETAKLAISGGTVNGTICGGGSSALCGNTDVSIESGSWGFIYGGGENGSVTGECHLVVSGNPTITGVVFGGSKSVDATVGSTRVEISGGTFIDSDLNTVYGTILAGGYGCTVTGNTYLKATGGTIGTLYGGCSKGTVNGATYVEVDGATMDGGTVDGNPNSAAVYGGGRGVVSQDDSGNVGSTKVVIKSIGGDRDDLIVFGGGLYGSVTTNTDVTIEGGKFQQVWGSSYASSGNDSENIGKVGGNVNVLVKGGEIGTLGAARDQAPGQPVYVTGTMNLTIEGGKITDIIMAGNHKNGGDYKPCTLTIRNLGNANAPYALPTTLAITDMVLDNSTVTYLPVQEIPGSGLRLNSIVVDKDHPMTISGNGKLVGDRIILDNFQTGTSLPVDVPLVTGDEQLKDASFVAYEGLGDGTSTGISTLPIYKVGDTYRKTEKTETGGDIVKAKIVTITQPSHGELTVKWVENNRENILDDGDQVPAGTKLTLSLTPNSGYQGGKIYVDGQPLTGSTYTVTDDVIISASDITQTPDPEPEPVPPVYHTVTLPAVEGAITNPIAGDYDIEAWDNFRFYLTLDKEYDQSEPIITTDRGETIQPRTSDGAYIIKYVRQPIVIKIDGVVKNPDPVANETVDTGGIKIYTANGYLHIQAPQPEQVHIFTPDGRLLKAFRTSGNEEQIALPKGIYLIRVTNQCVKVVL